jgi:hypothetical protein
LYNNMCINSLDGGVVPINGRFVFKKLFGVLWYFFGVHVPIFVF